MGSMHYLGAALVLALVTAVGVWSGRQVKSAGDFSSGGRKAGLGVVAGAIIGSLVGGSSTIGTAQLAFTHGFSAWWFTLGGGLGCLVLGLFFAGPLHRSGITTLPQVFEREYGRAASTAATLLTGVGNFLTIASQVLSGVALITAVSAIGQLPAAGLTIALMLAYVVFGGVWGAGYVGMAKTLLLYAGVGGCGVVALLAHGGFAAFRADLPSVQFFNLFARGTAVDLGACASLIVGVITTQAYIGAVISARSLRLSRAGVLLCAALVPLIGVAGTFVGLYMRIHNPDIDPATALPRFVLDRLPALPAGMVLAALLVALVGTGAGISLGISSMVCNDLYRVWIKPDASDRQQLRLTRGVIVAVLAAAALFTAGNMGSLILEWGFLSMALRGAVAFFPLCAALFLPGRIAPRWVVAAMVAGPAAVLGGKLWLPSAIDPLFYGMLASLILMAAGWAAKRTTRPPTAGNHS